MGSPNPLARWLGGLPGHQAGATEGEAVENAFAAYLADGGDLSYGDFVVALDRAGYFPLTCVRNHDTGAWRYRVMLPEGTPDHGVARLH